MPIQKRILIRADATQPCANEFGRIDHGVKLLRVEPGLRICSDGEDYSVETLRDDVKRRVKDEKIKAEKS